MLSGAGNRNEQEPQSRAHTASGLAVLPVVSVWHRARPTLPDCLAVILFLRKIMDVYDTTSCMHFQKRRILSADWSLR